MRSPVGFLFLCMALLSSAHALTLAEAQRLALIHNPDLAGARLELQAQQGAELSVGWGDPVQRRKR